MATTEIVVAEAEAEPMSSDQSTESRKVLIAVDMNTCSEDALDWYVSNIHQPGNEVICFHAMDPPSISGEVDYQEGKAIKFAMEGCKASVSRIEEKFGGRLKMADIEGRILSAMCSRPGEAIVELARAESVTMIVVGNRGGGAVRRTVLGSTSDYVLHHATCPVVICMSNKVQRRRSRSSSFSTD